MTMKYGNQFNLFWAIVWAVILIGAIIGWFWRPAIVGIAIISVGMIGMYIAEFIRVNKFK